MLSSVYPLKVKKKSRKSVALFFHMGMIEKLKW